MTKRECAIISAYTGIFMGDFDTLYDYYEEILGFRIYTHQIPEYESQIKDAARVDFIRLNKEAVEEDVR